MQLSNRHSLARFVAAPVLSLAAVAALAEDSVIRHEQEVANDHYALASKDFGNGVVQLHARQDGSDGATHRIYHFDCSNKKYDILFSGASDPDGFPMDASESAATPIEPDDGVTPLAQHACTQHGYPLMKW